MCIRLRGENGDSALVLARLITLAGAVRFWGRRAIDGTDRKTKGTFYDSLMLSSLCAIPALLNAD